MNKNVGEVDDEDCESGKARYLSTENLLIEEFEKKEKLVSIAKKELPWTSGLVGTQIS